jgi:hypothetical protein
MTTDLSDASICEVCRVYKYSSNEPTVEALRQRHGYDLATLKVTK